MCSSAFSPYIGFSSEAVVPSPDNNRLQTNDLIPGRRAQALIVASNKQRVFKWPKYNTVMTHVSVLGLKDRKSKTSRMETPTRSRSTVRYIAATLEDMDRLILGLCRRQT